MSDWTRGLSRRQMAVILNDEEDKQAATPDRHPQRHIAIDIRNELLERDKKREVKS